MRAAVYTRISKDKAGAGMGVDRQRADCEDLAGRLGWTVVEHYSDNDLSAYSGKPRPGYRALLEAIRAGLVTGVLVWHTDRLHRRPVELEDYISACEEHGVTTHTVKAGQIDLSTANGRMQARIAGAVARQEVEHMIERQHAAKAQAAAQGRWLGGRRPYGYEADGVTVRFAEAVELLKATEALLGGASLRGVCADMNARGVTTSTGKPWRPTELRKAVSRARNAGLLEHRGQIVATEQAPWPAIVPEDTWRAVRALLSDETRRTSPGSARRWLGGGLYLCGVCEGTLTASTRGASGRSPSRASTPVYRCDGARHVARDCVALDEYVGRLVVARLSREDAVDLARSPDVDTGPLHLRAASLRERITEANGLYAAGSIDAGQLTSITAKVRADLDGIEATLAVAASRSVFGGLVGPDVNVRAVWDGLDLGRRRAVVDTLLTVRVLPAKRGRPAGWVPGTSYFDPAAVAVEWAS